MTARPDRRRDSRDHAPAPDHSQKPASPTRLEKRSWKYVLARTAREFAAHQCSDAAATLTYYATLAVFPALIAAFSLIGLVGQEDEAAAAVLGIVEEAAPGDAVKILRGPIERLSEAPGAGVAFITGILVALWSASGYVAAFSRAMNRIYEIEEGRPFWKLRAVQLLVTVIAILSLASVSLALALSGDVVRAIGNAIGAGAGVMAAWSILKWPLLVFVTVFLIAMLYYAAPNARQPRFRWISPGAVVAIAVLAIASAGFGVYVTNFSHYGRTYGSLAGVVVFLLWVWIANLALLFGAEFDAELERGRQLQAGMPAEEEVQLPPRDTRRSDKRARSAQKLRDEGKRLRSAHQPEERE